MKIELDKVVDWLDRYKLYDTVGYAGQPTMCPIANYLDQCFAHNGKHSVFGPISGAVGRIDNFNEPPDITVYEMSQEVSNLVLNIDIHNVFGTPVTKKHILNHIEADKDRLGLSED